MPGASEITRDQGAPSLQVPSQPHERFNRLTCGIERPTEPHGAAQRLPGRPHVLMRDAVLRIGSFRLGPAEPGIRPEGHAAAFTRLIRRERERVRVREVARGLEQAS
jgi:hypothetical protein